ncbi:MAG TPA: carbon-nitrogen family hydrolase [Halobacteria archaeon]|nr:carbon-nitrogen family hydrolase [Halobacteria archaeon]
MRISLAQMNIIQDDKKKNIDKALRFIKMADEQRSDVCVLPELFAGRNTDCAESIEDYTVKTLMNNSMNGIVFSFAEKSGKNIYNTAVILEKNAIVGKYRKIHLFKPMDEDKQFSSGCKPSLFNLNNIKSSVIICYDIRFSELITSLSINGAKIIYVIANFPYPRLNHWTTLLKARAIENQIFIVACNSVGINNEDVFFGHSMVIDPAGDVVIEGGEDEELLTVDIDFKKVDYEREKCFYLEDRKEECYKIK